MGLGDFANGMEDGLISFIGNLLWSALIPAIIFGCPEETKGIAILMTIAISAGWAFKDIACMISAPIGTIIGYLIAASMIASYDPSLAIVVALPAIVSVAIDILKITGSKSR